MSFTLTPDTGSEYFRRHDVVSGDVETESLGGGVSNRVVEVRGDNRCVVAKQPLPNLDVAEDWPADVDRVHNEAAAIRAYDRVLEGTDLNARVPAIRFEDRQTDVIALECAPDGARMWKRDLVEGRVDPDIARTLGAVLGTAHDAATNNSDLRDQFANKRPFIQLRIDPYHRTVSRRHPDLRDAILGEVDRITGIEKTLVHGDYSPKNVLVAPSGTLWLLDFEVAHWGDPAFDTAFMCNHLFINSVYNRERREAYVDAVLAFWDGYCGRVQWDIEAETVTELAVLMLARVDGKSPVEYVLDTPVEDALRQIAKRVLRDDSVTIAGFADRVRQEVEAL